MNFQRLLFVASLFLGSLYASVAYGSSNQYLSADNGNVSGFTRYKMSAPKTDFEVKQQSDCASLSAQSGGAHRVWSDKPAFTQVIENEDEHGLTSCLYDGVYEGDTVPLQPMAKCLPNKTRYWEQGEETNYLNMLTNLLTRGKYPNPVRLWEQESYFIGNGRLAASVLNGSGT